MADWRTTLEQAATLSRDATRHLPALLRLLESVVAGQATAHQIRDALGSDNARRPGFLAALDAALRSGSRTEPGCSAARAVLHELPDALDRLVQQGHDIPGDLGLVATLARLAARAGGTPDRGLD